jgi:hypothetical protein
VTGPLEQLLRGTALEPGPHAPNSRYHGIATAVAIAADGRRVRYLRRRFRPDPAAFGTAAEHLVADGERLDLLGFRYLGDALAAWRIADANDALRSSELCAQPGERIRIPLPTPGQEQLNA